MDGAAKDNEIEFNKTEFDDIELNDIKYGTKRDNPETEQAAVIAAAACFLTGAPLYKQGSPCSFPLV